MIPGCETCGPAGDDVSQLDRSTPSGCGSPVQVVADALHYFGQHFGEPIQIPSMAESLGISLDCLNFSFDRIRKVTPVQVLRQYRLSKLFVALTDQPRQGLGRAIRACGLAETTAVLAQFEQEFGIAMPLFLLTCRRAADDRLFRLQHPEAEALVVSGAGGNAQGQALAATEDLRRRPSGSIHSFSNWRCRSLCRETLQPSWILP